MFEGEKNKKNRGGRKEEDAEKKKQPTTRKKRKTARQKIKNAKGGKNFATPSPNKPDFPQLEDEK